MWEISTEMDVVQAQREQATDKETIKEMMKRMERELDREFGKFEQRKGALAS